MRESRVEQFIRGDDHINDYHQLIIHKIISEVTNSNIEISNEQAELSYLLMLQTSNILISKLHKENMDDKVQFIGRPLIKARNFIFNQNMLKILNQTEYIHEQKKIAIEINDLPDKPLSFTGVSFNGEGTYPFFFVSSLIYNSVYGFSERNTNPPLVRVNIAENESHLLISNLVFSESGFINDVWDSSFILDTIEKYYEKICKAGFGNFHFIRKYEHIAGSPNLFKFTAGLPKTVVPASRVLKTEDI